VLVERLRPDVAVISECAPEAVVHARLGETPWTSMLWAGSNRHKGVTRPPPALCPTSIGRQSGPQPLRDPSKRRVSHLRQGLISCVMVRLRRCWLG